MTAPRALPWPIPWHRLTLSGQAQGVTLGAIAAVLDVPRGTVDTWRRRGRAGVPFPEPARPGTRPRWLPSQVAAWARAVLDAEAPR